MCPTFSQYEHCPGPCQTHWVEEWPGRRQREHGAVTGAECVRGGEYTGVRGGEGDEVNRRSTSMG